jgi:PEP-CTERM motif
MTSFRHALMVSAVALMLPSVGRAVPVLFSVGGDDTTASIQTTVDQFRAAVGDPNNGNAPGPLAAGRREIGWDGGGAAAPVLLDMPNNLFQPNRGAFFEPDSTIFSISGAPDPEFSNINPTYDDIFSTFSSPRLFSPTNSNVTEQIFFVPGTEVRATTDSFGVVFTDVDLENLTRIDYLDINNALLESHFVEPGTVANGSFSFLGVVFDSSIVGRVRITTGNAILGPNDGAGIDVVAMDDFIFGEPQKVPEPGTLLLMGAGLAGIAAWGRKRGKATETQ